MQTALVLLSHDLKITYKSNYKPLFHPHQTCTQFLSVIFLARISTESGRNRAVFEEGWYMILSLRGKGRDKIPAFFATSMHLQLRLHVISSTSTRRHDRYPGHLITKVVGS